MIDEPLPFEAPLTEKAHVPPTATATSVPISPPPDGVEVGAVVEALLAVGLLVAVGVGVAEEPDVDEEPTLVVCDGGALATGPVGAWEGAAVGAGSVA